MAGPGPGHHGGKTPLTPSKGKGMIKGGLSTPQTKTPKTPKTVKTPTTKNTPAKIAKRPVVKKTPSKNSKTLSEKVVVESSSDEAEEEPKKVTGYVRKTDPPRIPGVNYTRDLHKIVNTPPKKIFKGKNVLGQPYQENEDERLEEMDPESKRLGLLTDKRMKEQDKGYTFGEFATSASKNSNRKGDVDSDSDDYDEKGMVPAGLASAKKPSDNKKGGSKNGKNGEVLEHEEKYWLNALGELIRIDPNNPEEPTACNNVESNKKKGPRPLDPNGRFIGRHLVNWQRERMTEKLVLNIQFECHKAGIDIPWDRIVHRLNPGSSGPTAPQMLNKLRELLIMEGHMVPPAMGKKSMKVDPMVRGYVRDETQKDPRAARVLLWTEPYENRKHSLTDHGHIAGSGIYRKLEKINPALKKEDESEDEDNLYTRPNYIPASQRQLMNRVKSGDGYRQYDGVVKNAKVKKEVKTDDEEDEEMAILPEELDPDDDYDPTPPSRRKGARSGRRRLAQPRVRNVPKVESDTDVEEEMVYESSSGSDDEGHRSLIVTLPIAVHIPAEYDAPKEEESPSARRAMALPGGQAVGDLMDFSDAEAEHKPEHETGLSGIGQGMSPIPFNDGGFSAFPSTNGMYANRAMSSDGHPASNIGAFDVNGYTTGTQLHNGQDISALMNSISQPHGPSQSFSGTTMSQSHNLLSTTSQSFSGYPGASDYDHYNQHRMIANGAFGANYDYMSFDDPAPGPIRHNVDADGFKVGDGATIGNFARRNTPEMDQDDI